MSYYQPGVIYEPGQTYQTPYGLYTAPGKLEPTALVALILAIGSFMFWIVPAVIALALAPTAKKRIAESNGGLSGGGIILAAQITAGVSLAIATIIVLVLLIN